MGADDTDTAGAGTVHGRNEMEDDGGTSTLASLSNLFLRALVVCRIGSRVFFALSPIAAYLPQYLAIQEDSKASTNRSSSNPCSPVASSSFSATAGIGSAPGSGGRSTSTGNLSHPTTHERSRASSRSTSTGSTMHHRRETRSRSPLGLKQANSLSPSTLGGARELQQLTFSGLQSPTIPPMHEGNDNVGTNTGGRGGGDRGGGGGGMSPISILILLLSHVLRLIYFYGHDVWLPSNNNKVAQTHGSRDLRLSETVDEVQYELIAQSFVMIAVQLLLVTALARSRMKSAKRMLDDHDHNDTTQLFCTTSGSFRRGDMSLVSYRQHDTTTNASRYGRGRKSALVSLGLAYIRFGVAKVINLLHPRRIWRYKNMKEYAELLALVMAAMGLYCRMWLFPTYGEAAINRIRNVSILLESCLALPQVIQNYGRKDTVGLSVIMVAGWIIGDFLKLVYFLLQAPGGGGDGSGGGVALVDGIRGSASKAAVAAAVAGAGVPRGSSTSGVATMYVFAGGCFVALVLDVLVLLQLVVWYPTQKMLAWKADCKGKSPGKLLFDIMRVFR